MNLFIDSFIDDYIDLESPIKTLIEGIYCEFIKHPASLLHKSLGWQ